MHSGTPFAHFTLCPSMQSHPTWTPIHPSWNYSLIQPDHNQNRLNYSPLPLKKSMWQGRIFQPIFICNNAGASCCQSSSRQVGNAAGGNRNVHRSVLKGPVDLLMLPHLKVATSPHPQQRRRCTKNLVCAVFACLFVSLKSCITPGYDLLPLRQEVDPTYFHAAERTHKIAGRSRPSFGEIKDKRWWVAQDAGGWCENSVLRWQMVKRAGNQKYSCHFFPLWFFSFLLSQR